MVIKMDKMGNVISANDMREVDPAQAQAASRTLADAVTDIVDSSGGTGTDTVTYLTGDFVNEADVATSLAGVVTTNAALDTVHDAIGELFSTANAVAAAIGVDQVTYSGGGTAPNGTIDAVTVTVTAVATGAQATEMNTTVVALSDALFTCGKLVQKLCDATGYQKPIVTGDGQGAGWVSTVAAITIDEGAAADPGVSKVAVDAKLAAFAVNIATLSDYLLTVTAAFTPTIIVEA